MKAGEFAPDAAFARGSVFAADWPLSQIRLQDDRRFSWVILIPRRPDAREIEDLSGPDRVVLMDEVVGAGALVRTLGDMIGRPVEKLNIAALGNVTPQLHLHIVGRRRDDACWPDPVWGQGRGEPYAPETLDRLRTFIASGGSGRMTEPTGV